MQPSSAERSILATLSYFDCFSYPLTPYETWKWLYHDAEEEPPELAEVFRLLRESGYLRERTDHAEGFYYLKGRFAIVLERKERYLLAERKYQQVLRAVRVLRFLPFLRAVAVCNSLAYSNTRDEGDLDVFVVTEPGRVWTARMFATGLASVLGWRPTADHGRDTLCLSFFLADSALRLAPFRLGEDDPYLRYWIDQLTPVYGDPVIFEELRAANAWHRDHLPNASGNHPTRRRYVVDTGVSRFVRSGFEGVHSGALGDALERRYRRFQERVLPEKLRRLANQDTRVVMNDAVLKFHENDRREEFRQKFAARLQEVQ